ncbi:hypothetical protein VP01_600g1 [Puccinia sorghi]|uniref:Uncharacterized protein n=1 Tax=Puccinia sorghi TaxID=27349 RepID=A0A0L6UHE8_9BASI|nr:hypothetical protein VP01_600g1 [Puccinia sorghi]
MIDPALQEVEGINLNYNIRKKQAKLAKTLGVSDRQVCQILDDAHKKRPSASTKQQGPKSKPTTKVLTSFLLFLEKNPTINLKKMSEHIHEEFDISITPEAIQRTLKMMKITWKSVTQIPQKWSKAAFSSAVTQLCLEPSDQAALRKDTKGSLINLIDAMAKEGMVYEELLTKDKKKNGKTLNDICNFILNLQGINKKTQTQIFTKVLSVFEPNQAFLQHYQNPCQAH